MHTLPATMIWVHDRWTLILHNEQKSHDAQEVRRKFLEQSPALHINMCRWRDGDVPIFTMDQDETFNPFFAGVQQNDTNIVVQSPGSNASWTIQIPATPQREVQSSDFNEPVIYSDSFPGVEDVFMTNPPVIDPSLLEQTQAQEKIEPLSSIFPTPESPLGDKNSIDKSFRLFSEALSPTANLDDLPFSGPTGLFSTPTYPEPPRNIAALSKSFQELATSSPSYAPSLVDDTESSSTSGSEYAGPSSAVRSQRGKQLRRRVRSHRARSTKRSAKLAEAERLRALLERNRRDDILVCGRALGLSYKQIKDRCNIPDAESTLRGRYRTLVQRMDEAEARLRNARRESEYEPESNGDDNDNGSSSVSKGKKKQRRR